jgi:hypothetical protein
LKGTYFDIEHSDIKLEVICDNCTSQNLNNLEFEFLFLDGSIDPNNYYDPKLTQIKIIKEKLIGL